MPTEDWTDYLEAACRKRGIAAFNLRRLKELLNPADPPEQLSIEIQAHFEGVVISVIAAVDQVAQAVNHALNLRAKPDDLVAKAFN
jgi:hypothetical protein